MPDWQEEWPKEEGYYWFFGYVNTKQMLPGDEPSFSFVDVYKYGDNKWTYEICDDVLYPNEACGKWLKVEFPAAPDISDLIL